MQSRKFSQKTDFFGHGSIFKITNLELKNSKGEDSTFADFYPEADLDGIEYAVLCTQDCDIEQEKVTHLNIALLEPIHRQKKENPIRFLDLEFKNLVTPFEDMNFYTPLVLNSLKNKVDALIDNTDAHFLFVDLHGSLHFINLTKLFPIKFKHRDSLKEQAEFQLDGSFKHLLGWKLASLYGRVGVDVYPPKSKTEIQEKILRQVFASLESYWPKNSYSLTEDQHHELQSDFGTYKQQKKSGKDATKVIKKILDRLDSFGIVSKDKTNT